MAAPGVVTVEWGAVAVCVAAVGAAAGAIRSALRAPDTLQRLYGEDRRRTRATIEGDHLVPTLGGLIYELRPIRDADDPPDPAGDLKYIQNQLQASDFMTRIEELSDWATDHRDLQRLQDEACRWSRRKGVAASIFLTGFVLPAIQVSTNGVALPEALFIPSDLLAALGVTFAFTFYYQETTARNRLSEIVRRYE